jgi:hypothetical protein
MLDVNNAELDAGQAPAGRSPHSLSDDDSSLAWAERDAEQARWARLRDR